MVAKLEWNTGRLWLGRLPLAQVRHTRKWGWQWTVYGEWKHGGYTEASVKDHCEAFVRRLLADAGVEVAPNDV